MPSRARPGTAQPCSNCSLAIIGRKDVFKIIDQGSDASVNACNLREFVNAMAYRAGSYDDRAGTPVVVS